MARFAFATHISTPPRAIVARCLRNARRHIIGMVSYRRQAALELAYEDCDRVYHGLRKNAQFDTADDYMKARLLIIVMGLHTPSRKAFELRTEQ